MSVQAVYSSTDPAVLADAATNMERMLDHHEAMAELRAEFGSEVYISDSWGERRSFAGFVTCPTAAGVDWRRVRHAWWPKKTTTAGKLLHKRLTALSFRWQPLTGMPHALMDEMTLRHHGWIEHDGTVWVSWSASHDRLDLIAPGKIDTAIWQRRKLGEYFTAIDERAERQRAEVAR